MTTTDHRHEHGHATGTPVSATGRTQSASPAERASSRCITRLQRRYRQDNSAAVAELARLRRGAGHTAHTVQDHWGLGGLEDLADILTTEKFSGRREHAEEAVYLAVTLWALHQQSSRERDMHIPRRTLGGAVRALIESKGTTSRTDIELDEPLRKRLVRVGTATSIESVALRLREIVLLLKGAQVPLDYGRLADQLYRWQSPGKRADVRREWGREFHLAARTRKNPGATTPDAAAAAEDDYDSGE